jgi:hypothetical protein
MTNFVNAMTWHHRKTVAGAYGEFPMAALYRELQKISDSLAPIVAEGPGGQLADSGTES